MIDRAESNDVSPNTSVFPIMTSPQTNLTEMESTHRRIHKNKTDFYQVSNKILEANTQDIQLDLSEEQGQDYFKQDPEEDEKVDVETLKVQVMNKKDNNAYETYFKPKIFLKFFVLHLLFFFILGPFIIILTPIVGRPLLHNLGFMGWQRTLMTQTIEYLCIVTFLVIYYATETEGLESMDIYMFFSTVVIAVTAMSSKYAYQNSIVLKLTHTMILPAVERRGDMILGPWRIQKDETIEEEIQAAILRLEIDSSLFFFNFLTEPIQQLKRKLSKNNAIGRLMSLAGGMNKNENNKKDNNIVSMEFPSQNQVLQNEDNYEDAEPGSNTNRSANNPPLRKTKKSQFEKIRKEPSLSRTTEAIMQSFAHFLEFKRLENSYLYGYNLMFDMLRNARDNRYKHLGKFLLFVSITRAFIPTFYRLYLVVINNEDIPVFTSKPYIILISFIINSLLFWGNIFTISIALLDLKSKIFCFKQIGFLISPKKICFYREHKVYPTLNIFDPLSLKTWSNLRRIISEYGRKYTLRNNFNATIIMTFYFFILAIFALQMLGIVNAYDSPLMMIVFGYESVIMGTIFISIMFKGAYINDEYKTHKNLLKKNKTIISDFQRLSYLYVGENAIEPDNCIYREGLRLMKKELGEEDFEEKLVERSQKLTAMIDDIIEELKFEEENEPFSVMGIPITYTLLKGVGVAIVSLLFALSQTALN